MATLRPPGIPAARDSTIPAVPDHKKKAATDS